MTFSCPCLHPCSIRKVNERMNPFHIYFSFFSLFFCISSLLSLPSYLQGGPIIAFQIENEYGYFGNDHAYLGFLKDKMIGLGITSILFASNGYPLYLFVLSVLHKISHIYLSSFSFSLFLTNSFDFKKRWGCLVERRNTPKYIEDSELRSGDRCSSIL